MKYHARVLHPTPGFDLREEALRLGADEAAAAWVAQQGEAVAFGLDSVPTKAAMLIAQVARGCGGEAWSAESGQPSGSSALLVTFGRSQMEVLLRALRVERGVAREVGAEMASAWERGARPTPAVRCGDGVLEFGRRTLVMGIINVTPDSFSGDGAWPEAEIAIECAREAVRHGADILDIGGESTRPGAEPVSLTEELRRTLPVVEAAAGLGVPVSIDTSKAEVARAALGAGAAIINDVTALRGDPEMARVAAEAGCPVVLMHMLGRPRTMQDNPQYGDVVAEVYAFLADRIEAAIAAGIAETQIIVDPGFGFGKRLGHNLELLRRLRELRSLGRPILAGTSRKAMIGAVLGLPADQRLAGTAATVACAIQNGADLVRVHDVEAMTQVARLADAICRPGWTPGG